MDEIVTSDLSRFGSRERLMLVELLQAWRAQGLPADFIDNEVRPVMNTNSGYVFLTNSDYQVAMMNGNRLESWYTCPNCGNEGFLDDLKAEKLDPCCKEYIAEIEAE